WSGRSLLPDIDPTSGSSGSPTRRPCACAVASGRLPSEESPEECRRVIRDADDLVRSLTIEFEVELGPGSAVGPGGKRSELAPAQAPLRPRRASDGDAHARCLSRDPTFPWDRGGRGHGAAGDETWPAFVLAREDEDRIACADVLAAIHRLLRLERERLRPRIRHLDFDGERHAPHRARPIPGRSIMAGRLVVRRATTTSRTMMPGRRTVESFPGAHTEPRRRAYTIVPNSA